MEENPVIYQWSVGYMSRYIKRFIRWNLTGEQEHWVDSVDRALDELDLVANDISNLIKLYC
jgi:hypothetical protein